MSDRGHAATVAELEARILAAIAGGPVRNPPPRYRVVGGDGFFLFVTPADVDQDGPLPFWTREKTPARPGAPP